MKDLLDVEMLNQNISDKYADLENLPLAYAYVPYQSFETPYSKEKSLDFGTVFPALNKPYSVYGKEFNQKAGAVRL